MTVVAGRTTKVSFENFVGKVKQLIVSFHLNLNLYLSPFECEAL
jgi:hypothetical protein